MKPLHVILSVLGGAIAGAAIGLLVLLKRVRILAKRSGGFSKRKAFTLKRQAR